MRPAVGKEGAQVGCGHGQQAEPADLFAAMPGQEVEEPMRGGDISAHRVRRPAAVMGKKTGPARGQGASRMA